MQLVLHSNSKNLNDFLALHFTSSRNLLIDIAHHIKSLKFWSHGFFKEKLSPTISSTRDASQQLAPPGPSTLWCRMVLIMIKPRLVPTSWRRTILQRPTFFPMLIVPGFLIDYQSWCVITNNPSHVSADTYTPILFLCHLSRESRTTKECLDIGGIISALHAIIICRCGIPSLGCCC